LSQLFDRCTQHLGPIWGRLQGCFLKPPTGGRLPGTPGSTTWPRDTTLTADLKANSGNASISWIRPLHQASSLKAYCKHRQNYNCRHHHHHHRHPATSFHQYHYDHHDRHVYDRHHSADHKYDHRSHHEVMSSRGHDQTLGYPGVPRGTPGVPRGTPRYPGYPGVPRGTPRYPGVPRGTPAYPGTLPSHELNAFMFTRGLELGVGGT
jgi:hypothetical protein